MFAGSTYIGVIIIGVRVDDLEPEPSFEGVCSGEVYAEAGTYTPRSSMDGSAECKVVARKLNGHLSSVADATTPQHQGISSSQNIETEHRQLNSKSKDSSFPITKVSPRQQLWEGELALPDSTTKMTVSAPCLRDAFRPLQLPVVDSPQGIPNNNNVDRIEL